MDIETGEEIHFAGVSLLVIFCNVAADVDLAVFDCGLEPRLFGVLLSAYLSGVVVEDFMWYVVNPEVKLAEFGPKFVTYHPWLRVGKIHLPMLYVTAIIASVSVWFFVWR